MAQAESSSVDSKPIVDVRFDGPYRQVESSMGDEWAPTWAWDDVLYTGNDDGTSFGGIAQSNIAFGKLYGDDPHRLSAATVSGMKDYIEPPYAGPEGAAWNRIETVKVHGTWYRPMPCGTDACLATSSDDGKTWHRSIRKMPFRSAASFIHLSRSWESFLGGKPGEYLFAASFGGIIDGTDQYLVGRIPATKLPTSDTRDWSVLQADFSWGNLEHARPKPNSTGLGPDGANWKLMNAYAIDGALYMFITRCVYPSNSSDPQHRHWWLNASIIKSTDGGKTWTRAAKDNYDQPMFPGHRFATAYFVWYGKNGAANVDNADKYVYAVSNNGFFENGDDYVLGRVLRSRLAALSPKDWSFYQSGDGLRDASWASSMDEARPILRNERRASMTGMTYIGALHRYIMVLWHYHAINFEQGIRDHDLSTVLEFFEAPKPWGPWTKFKTFDTGNLGWYTPIIGQRFQTPLDGSTVKVYMYATGYFTKPEGGLDMSLYKFDYMPITLSTRTLSHSDSTFVGGH
jgi:hypothetical protein